MVARTTSAVATTASRLVGLGVRSLVAALIAVALVVISSSPALAHAELVSSDPADGATLTGAVGAVTLVFNEKVGADLVAITLTGSIGLQAALAPPSTVGAQVIQPLPRLLNDRYILDYRIVSVDGHTVRGSIGFTLTGAEVGQGGGPHHGHHAATPATATAADQPAAALVEEQSSTPVWAFLLGGAVVLAAAAVLLVRRLGRD